MADTPIPAVPLEGLAARLRDQATALEDFARWLQAEGMQWVAAELSGRVNIDSLASEVEALRAGASEGASYADQKLLPEGIRPKIVTTLNARQLHQAWQLANPDPGDEDQEETEIAIRWWPGGKDTDGDDAAEGYYAHLSEYPEEGSLWLDPDRPIDAATRLAAPAPPTRPSTPDRTVIAYEFLHANGHAIVDYTEHTHIGHLSAEKGYVAHPLVKASERDQWAAKAQEWRRKYAELRYPGMTAEVRAATLGDEAAPMAVPQAPNEWETAVLDEVAIQCWDCSIDTPARDVVKKMMAVAVQIALDPTVSSEAAALVASGAAPQAPRMTDADVQAWADRHDLGISSITDLRVVFEDAQSLHKTIPPATKETTNG